MTAAQPWEGTFRIRSRYLGSQLLALLLVLASLCLRWELALLERWGYRRRCPGQASSFLRRELQFGVHSRLLSLAHHRLKQLRHLRDHHGLGRLCHGPCLEGHHGLLEPCPLCCTISDPWAATMVLRRRMVGRE